jgi:cytochrome c553
MLSALIVAGLDHVILGAARRAPSGNLMKKLASALLFAALPLAAYAADAVPTWAFFFPDQVQPQMQEAPGPKRVEGSDRTYTQAQIDDLKNPPDWLPNTHPAMPPVVARGGEGPMGLACASCHLTSGMGHPESSSLAGLTVTYMERQIADFRSGARRNPIMVNGQPQNNATQYMVGIAKALSPADSHAAAEYFASLPPLPGWVKVVEAANVPKTFISRGYMRMVLPAGGMEPIGTRVIEVPQDVEKQLARDPRSGTIAYVPPGSIKRGEALATTGGGKTIQCTICHGPGLKGLADVPHIAGRSPTYTFRQLYSFKDSSRGGDSAALMKGVVANLTQDDMVALAAYAASLAP